jgi:hypothetical protein
LIRNTDRKILLLAMVIGDALIANMGLLVAGWGLRAILLLAISIFFALVFFGIVWHNAHFVFADLPFVAVGIFCALYAFAGIVAGRETGVIIFIAIII